MVDKNGLTQPMRSDIAYAHNMVHGSVPPVTEDDADISSLCETVCALYSDRAALIAERDAMKAAIAELAPETAKLRAALETAATERAIAIAERDALKADAKLGALVRQIPVMGELTSYNVLRFNTDGSQYGVRVWTLGKAGFHLSKGATPEEALSVLLDGEVPA